MCCSVVRQHTYVITLYSVLNYSLSSTILHHFRDKDAPNDYFIISTLSKMSKSPRGVINRAVWHFKSTTYSTLSNVDCNGDQQQGQEVLKGCLFGVY